MDEQGQSKVVQLPIEYHIPDDMAINYATNLVVNHTEHEFVISFFEVYPPTVLGTPDEIREHLARMPSVRARCISRIVVAAGRMPEFVQVLKDNLEKYLSTRKSE